MTLLMIKIEPKSHGNTLKYVLFGMFTMKSQIFKQRHFVSQLLVIGQMIYELATSKWVYLVEGYVARQWLPSEIAQFVKLSCFFPSLLPQQHASFYQARIISRTDVVRILSRHFIESRVLLGLLFSLLVLNQLVLLNNLVAFISVNCLKFGSWSKWSSKWLWFILSGFF